MSAKPVNPFAEADAEIERWLNMSDEDVYAAIREAGEDPAAIARNCREMVEKAVATMKRTERR
jgi:hypothetical protein